MSRVITPTALRRTLLLSLVGGVTWLVVEPTHSLGAYELKGYAWTGDPTLRIATVSFPSASVWRADLENAIGRWNSMWGMWLEFDPTFVNYSTFTTGDGHNNVAFLDAEEVDGAWGVTWTRSFLSWILETDIGFNADLTWNTGAQDERVRDETRPAFRKVAVHELGHALGLAHYCSELAQMAQGFAGHLWYGGSATYRHHPSPDDAQGARAQYPYPSNSERDATMLNFEMDGSCDSDVWRSNTTVTAVAGGASIDVEYTVANVGNVGIDFTLGVYLSTDEYISIYDRYLGGFSYYLPAHYAWERDKTFTIPCSVPAGIYYIGAVVDPQSALAEVRESNNRIVFPGRWRVDASPDLIVESLTHSPASPSTADTITFAARVQNTGCGTAQPSTLALKVGGETVPVEYSVPSLATGATYTAYRRVRLSVAQNYLNTATVDVRNDVAEANETNNQKTDAYTVSSP